MVAIKTRGIFEINITANHPGFLQKICSADCFTVLDSAATRHRVKLKESMYINIGKA